MTKKEHIKNQVYAKCNGHCGYCGTAIAMHEMQIDHITPQIHYKWYKLDGMNEMDNLLPTCVPCNHYKRAQDLEQWRRFMKTLHQRLAKLPKKTQVPRTMSRKIYLWNVAVRYGITETMPFDGIFYFEKTNNGQ